RLHRRAARTRRTVGRCAHRRGHPTHSARADHGGSDGARAVPAGAAWRSALGGTVLRADWGPASRHGRHPPARAGVLFDLRARSEGRTLGWAARAMMRPHAHYHDSTGTRGRVPLARPALRVGTGRDLHATRPSLHSTRARAHMRGARATAFPPIVASLRLGVRNDRTPITRSTELAALRRGLPRWDTARGRRVHPEGRNTLFLVLMRDGFLVLLRDRLLVLARERRARQHEHGQIRER